MKFKWFKIRLVHRILDTNVMICIWVLKTILHVHKKKIERDAINLFLNVSIWSFWNSYRGRQMI